MQAHEIVMREVQARGSTKVLDLLREGIGQARETAHGHVHRQILALHKACRNMSLIGASGHHDLLLAHDAGRRVPTGAKLVLRRKT
jgi:hypothetical protein